MDFCFAERCPAQLLWKRRLREMGLQKTLYRKIAGRGPAAPKLLDGLFLHPRSPFAVHPVGTVPPLKRERRCGRLEPSWLPPVPVSKSPALGIPVWHASVWRPPRIHCSWQRTLVSRKRAKIGARAGPIWHYVALRGTRAPPTCTRTCAFEGPLGSPRRAIQPSSREKTAHDLRVGELQWPPEDGEYAAKNGTKRGGRQCGCTSSFRRASGTSPVAQVATAAPGADRA